MQTPVSLMVLGVSVLIAIPLHAQRPDREAQTRALEALREKMSEMDNAPAPVPDEPAPPPAVQPPPSAPVKTVAPPVTPAPATEPAEVPSRPAKIRNANSEFGPVPPSSDIDSKLRQALDEKFRETEGSPVPTGASRSVAGSSPVFSEPPSASSAPVFSEPPPASSSLPGMVSTPGATPPPQMRPIVTGDGISKALNPPPSSVSGAKEQKLADLLQQYRANTISPEQYHKQRAEILAGN